MQAFHFLKEPKIYQDPSADKYQEKVALPAKRRRESLTVGQIALCKVEAEQKLKKRMDYGLGCTTPDDYFKLLELKNDAW